MKETISKIKHEVAEGFVPIAKTMRSEGIGDSEILKVLRNHIDLKIRHFYRKAKEPTSMGETIRSVLSNPPDSRAETAFLTLLDENKIPFTFQRKIGPFRVDYLINDQLVLELDGPHHNGKRQKQYDKERDMYLERMGYQVLRVPIWLAATSPDAILETVKDFLE